MRFVCFAVLVGLITFSTSCSNAEKERADRKTAEAKAQAREAIHKTDQELKHLAQQAKSEARQFDANAHRALQGSNPGQAESSDARMSEANQKARVAAHEAEVDLNRMALIARIKSKLAADAGLSTVTDVRVDTSGHVVTLRGTVNSEQQKRLAEEAAMQVNGVSKVVDDLTVRQ